MGHINSVSASEPRNRDSGFSLIEMLIAVAIIGILASISVKIYGAAVYESAVTRAIADIREIAGELEYQEGITGVLPATLADIGWTRKDPWGFEYVYHNFYVMDPSAMEKGHKPKNARRDKLFKPLNSRYDLFSTGPDHKWKQQLNSKDSLDDVIRARDGLFIGQTTDW